MSSKYSQSAEERREFCRDFGFTCAGLTFFTNVTLKALETATRVRSKSENVSEDFKVRVERCGKRSSRMNYELPTAPLMTSRDALHNLREVMTFRESMIFIL